MTTSQQGQSSKLLKQALEKLENVRLIMNRETVMQTDRQINKKRRTQQHRITSQMA